MDKATTFEVLQTGRDPFTWLHTKVSWAGEDHKFDESAAVEITVEDYIVPRHFAEQGGYVTFLRTKQESRKAYAPGKREYTLTEDITRKVLGKIVSFAEAMLGERKVLVLMVNPVAE